MRRWTTARKFDGSAWTKVVVGGVLVSEAMMRMYVWNELRWWALVLYSGKRWGLVEL